MNAIHCLIIVSMFAMIQHGASDPKCKPHKMKPTEKVTIDYLYVNGFNEGLLMVLCGIYENFTNFISIKYRMGSQTNVVNGELNCGDGDCDSQRRKACQYKLLTPAVYNAVSPCDYLPFVNEEELEDCIINKEADKILIDNGEERKQRGIPDGTNAAFVFNGTYYKCANLSSAEALAKFLCLMYNNNIKPCEKPK